MPAGIELDVPSLAMHNEVVTFTEQAYIGNHSQDPRIRSPKVGLGVTQHPKQPVKAVLLKRGVLNRGHPPIIATSTDNFRRARQSRGDNPGNATNSHPEAVAESWSVRRVVAQRGKPVRHGGQLDPQGGSGIGVAKFLLGPGEIGEPGPQVLQDARSAELLGKAPEDVEGLLVVGGGSGGCHRGRGRHPPAVRG